MKRALLSVCAVFVGALLSCVPSGSAVCCFFVFFISCSLCCLSSLFITSLGKRELVTLLSLVCGMCTVCHGLWYVYYLSWFVVCVLSVIVCGMCTVCHSLWYVYCLSWSVVCVLSVMVCGMCTVCHSLWYVYCLSWSVVCVLSVMVCGMCTVCHGLWYVYCLS